MSRRARSRPDKRATALDLARTGWPAGMLQDDSRELSAALSESPGAKRSASLTADEIRNARIFGHGTPMPDEARGE